MCRKWGELPFSERARLLGVEAGLLPQSQSQSQSRCSAAVNLVQTDWPCTDCSSSFPSRRALTSHAAKAHGHIRLARRYVSNGTCPFCCKDYGTRVRVIHHIHHWSRTCFGKMTAGAIPALDLEHVRSLDEQDCALRRAHYRAGTLITSWTGAASAP